MISQFRTAATMLAVFTLLTGVIYPLAVTVVAQVVFTDQANGSLIWSDDSAARNSAADANRYDWSGTPSTRLETMPVGSKLIGQPFQQAKYFWGRLSATSPVPYNASSSGGSNYGPLHPALKEAAAARSADLRKKGETNGKIPVDLVTASGSGLDPHISPAAAEFQVARVAAARNMKQFAVRERIRQHTSQRQWGVLGEPRVNVLELNRALDRLEHED